MRKKFLWVLLACVMAFSLAAFTACEADMTDEDTVRATGVTLNETSISLAVGEQFQLTATPTPENATDPITWHTSDKSIAEVTQDGLVTAVSLGTVEGATTATVTITVQIYTAKATCTVTVTPAEDLPAESVDLPDTASVEKGSTTTLSATVLPQGTTDEVEWTIVSGDENVEIAPSSDGLTCTVEGVAAGSAVIQATAGDFSDTCTVTVTDNGGGTEPEPPVEVESVTVTPETAQVDIAGTVSLTAELAPAGATGTVAWSTSDDTVATVSPQGVVTGVSEGKATITATVGEFSDTCVVSVFPNMISVNGTAYSMSIGTTRTTSTGTDPANTWWSLNEEGEEDPAYNSGNIGRQQLNGNGAVAFYWTKDSNNEYNSDLIFELIGNISSTDTYYDAQVFNGPTTPWGGLGAASSTQLSVTVNGEAYSGDTFPGLDASGAQANNTTFSMYGDYRAVFARSGNYCTLQIAFAQANSSDVYVYTYTFELVSGTPDALTVQFVGNPYGIENTMQYTSVTLNAVNA